MVHAELRCKPRYLHPAVGRGSAGGPVGGPVGGPSAGMRAARSEARRQRALSTVRFMIRRVHDCVRGGQYRDVENVRWASWIYFEDLFGPPTKAYVAR